MKCNIHTYRDLSQKLNDTVCRYKGIPYYVRIDEDRRNEPVILLYDIVSVDIKEKIKYDDPDFDISGVPLGYCQKHDGCKVVYITRLPLRRVRQGVCAQHLRTHAIQGHAWTTAHTVLRTQGFYNMVVGDYLPLDVALKTLRSNLEKDREFEGEVAVRRDIALSINTIGVINVYYKQQLVGWMEPNKEIVHIPTGDIAWVISKYLSHILGWEID